MRRSGTEQAGFTVLELMIATLVFSVILTVITSGVISFTNRYYRAANSSATQNTAQAILDTVTQAIQFGKGDVPDLTHVTDVNGHMCAGGQYISFNQADGKYTGTGSQTGFQIGPDSGACISTNSPRQLINKNMRIAHFLVTASSNNIYNVELAIAYGDDDLLCAPESVPGSCDDGAADLSSFWYKDITCKVKTDSQFCAVSHLKTSVQKRL